MEVQLFVFGEKKAVLMCEKKMKHDKMCKSRIFEHESRL